jgi:fructose-1,6-bisphosphatase I
VNEAHYSRFPAATQAYLDWVETDEAGGYSLRYVGSLVADFHRTLMNGGVFLYPETTDSPNGKLRLLYEANPLAFLAEQAGGKAVDGTERILQKQPQSMHERTPLIIGSSAEVDRVLSFRDQDQDGGT